ncbi:MAG: Ig-like domain-containing protein [Bacteroidia bacterium]
MKTKIFLLSLGLALFGARSHAQNGLVKVEVEKYYVANAADAAAADIDATNAGVATGALPAGSVTYRVYADMLPGYKFEALYGNAPHPLKISTSTSFYNNSAGGNTPTNWGRTAVKLTSNANNVLGLDSWFSVGATANNAWGVIKQEDSSLYGGNLIGVVAGGALQNNAALAGIPLTTKDGYLYSALAPTNVPAPPVVTYVGLSTELNVFTDGTTVGNSFTTTNGSVASLNGSVGPTASNKVLLGQFTIAGSGTFNFQFNIQIGTPSGGTQTYVASNPASGEISIPSMTYPVAVVPPTVAITSPANGATFIAPNVVVIKANATAADGTNPSVKFLVDGTAIGTVNTPPYQVNYTSVAGTHTVTAVATDDNSAVTTSAPVTITVTADTPPTVSITAPANGTNYIAPAVVNITATAADADGTVKSVQFFVDSVSIGIDTVAPYAINYTSVVGNHSLTAKATDNAGMKTTSAPVSIVVKADQPPVVSVSVPSAATVGDVINVIATASDPDGTVSSVEFFVDGTSIGVVNASPFQINWTATLGTHSITAKATDNGGLKTTSSAVSITVTQDIPPVVSITGPANGANYTAPAVVTIIASASDPDGTVSNVEFFVNGVSIGVVASAPYQKNWTSVIGTANLTAVATDNKGLKTTSAMVTINIADPNHLPYKLSQLKDHCLGTTFCEQVLAVDSVKNVIGYDLVLHYNKTKVTPSGNITLGSDLINSAYVTSANSIDTANSLVNISLYLNSSAPGNAYFHGIGNLACVEFNKTNAFAPVDTAVFTVSNIQESYIIGVANKSVTAGRYSSYRDSIFNASLNFWLDNSPILYNSANPNQYLITNIYGNNSSCSGMSAVAVQPDLSGNFSYDILKGTDVQINRDILPATDVQPVINGIDAQLVRKVLINDPSFVPGAFQMVAMDVNLDGVISAGDVSQINQRSVLMIPEFKQAWNYNNQGVRVGGISKDWLFIDNKTETTGAAFVKSATFPFDDGHGFSKARVPVIPFCLAVPVANLSACPLFAAESYKGILLGDVNGNYKDIAPDGVLKAPVRVNATDKVVIDMSRAVVTGSQIDIPISVSATDTINALDFSFKFDETKLQYDTVDNAASYIQCMAYLNTNDQTLRFTSNSLQQYSVGQSIVNVRFTMLAGNTTSADLNTLKGYLNGSATNVVVIDRPLNVLNANADNLIRIYPNPASSTLNVEVPEKANIQLMDASGREVFLKAEVSANQKLEINTQDLSAGVYMVKIYCGSFVSVKKVVINK